MISTDTRTYTIRDMASRLEPRDFLAGTADIIGFLLMFGTFTVLLVGVELSTTVGEYLGSWIIWEGLAVLTTPAIIWIFETRGPESPREYDVPRKWRVILCVSFLVCGYGFSGFYKFLVFAWPFLLVKATPFLSHQPVHKDLQKAMLKFVLSIFFVIAVGAGLEFFWAIVGVDTMRLENLGVFFLGSLYFFFLGSIDVLALPLKRMIAEEDAKATIEKVGAT